MDIITPRNSYVRFDGELPEDHCIFGRTNWCLPVLLESDIAFQFVVQGTIEEIDTLCDPTNSGINIGLVAACDFGFDVEFDEAPERFRISPTQVLYNWAHGLPGMLGFYNINDCFYIQIVVPLGDLVACSNCLQRIGNGCFSSVLEYGNEENAFGFNYCNSGAIETGEATGTCEPTIIEFVNKLTLDIPYTAGLAALYGTVPTVQTWIYDVGGALVNMGIQATFDAMPPSMISFDFGGIASGIIVIR